MPYPYTLMPDGHTMEPQEESTQAPKPVPVTGQPASDSGPSPHLTEEAAIYAQPPSTDEEVERRKQRTENAWERFQKAKQSANTGQSSHDHGDRNGSQSSGQGTSSDSSEQSKSGKKDVKDDSPAERAPVTDLRDFEPDAIDEEPAAEAVWHENTPLTPGQQMHVEHLLSVETDTLAREVLFTLQRDGLPPRSQWNDFMAPYALMGWYAASDAIAWATLAKIANSEWDETLAYADSQKPVLLQEEQESYIPLTPGQAYVVDDLLTQNIDGLAREALFALKQDGLPPENQWNEFIAQLEFLNGEETSDAQALLMLETVASSDWNQLVAHKDSPQPVLLQEEQESYISLTPGQAYVVDELLTQNIDGLAREALIALKRDGLPPENQWNEFIAQLEIPNGDETSDEQALETLALIASSDWNQLVAQRDSPESILLQEEHSEAQARAFQAGSLPNDVRQYLTGPIIEVAGTVPVFSDQWSAQDQKEHFLEYKFSSTNKGNFRLLGRSIDDPYTVMVEQFNPILYSSYRYWINLKDPDTDYTIVGATIESLPTVYVQQSMIADYTLDIELSGPPVWADRAKRGVFSRDLNTRGRNEAFAVQSPVIGEDVRVEYVAREEMETFGLGNYVVISFPASVYQNDPSKMLRLGVDPNHKPDKWREDGRVYVAYAHLEKINPKIKAGVHITDRDIAIIGTTGNTGLAHPDTKLPYKTEYENRHLDLVVVYYGSADESLEQAYSEVKGSTNPITAFFGFAQRSNLDGDTGLYGENLDPVLLWPEFDELGRALDNVGMSIYRNIGHEE